MTETVIAFRKDDGQITAAVHGVLREDIAMVLSAAGFTSGIRPHEYVLDPSVPRGDGVERVAYVTSRLAERGVETRLDDGLQAGPPMLPDPGRAIAEIRLLTASLEAAWNPHEVALHLHRITAYQDSVLAAVDDFIDQAVTWMGRTTPVAEEALGPYARATRTHLGRGRVTAERLTERFHSLAELLDRAGERSGSPRPAAQELPAKYPTPPPGCHRNAH